jgi:hypothetical protein
MTISIFLSGDNVKKNNVIGTGTNSNKKAEQIDKD